MMPKFEVTGLLSVAPGWRSKPASVETDELVESAVEEATMESIHGMCCHTSNGRTIEYARPCFLLRFLNFDSNKKDNRTFLIPWLVCVSMATLLDVFLCIYLTAKDSSDPLHSLLFITDFFFSALNVYCLLCVISQYQEYTAGRGRPEDCIRMEAEPNAQCLRFHWPSFQVLNQPPADQERAQEGTSDGNFLTVPGAQANPLNKCHKSSESINSCAKNTTSVQSTDEAIEAV
ncbi:hypothetical protein HNY73_002013 [Argiope bruennichi]|uniref:Uncharacterized protein n=1 Tax=Argiope bruennichi TaxID=94029 RepID=A0A8T0FS57_ARGBR|nr:hypothetical protein HNY73_002013 [Argiope bruennichi]